MLFFRFAQKVLEIYFIVPLKQIWIEYPIFQNLFASSEK